MRPNTLSRRRRLRLDEAVEAVRSGMTLRDAEKVFRIARSTLHRHTKGRERPASPEVSSSTSRKLGRPPAFAAGEEEVIVELLTHYAHRGLPLSRLHAQEAFQIFVSRLPLSRQAALPFRDGKPGVKFMRNFARRHRDRLRFAKPLRQEAKRFSAANAEALTTHFAALARLVEDLGVDAARVWNLDETGATPDREVAGAALRRRYMTRSGGGDLRLPDFASVHRSTMMPVISAAGEAGPVLFAFKGSTLPYREVVCGRDVVVETLADRLPRTAVVTTRAECGGVDSGNFYLWATHFVAFIAPLTAGGRKVLLLYDGYRAHMTLRVLELFDRHNIVAYALPAHTSGKTQPCDVVLFASYKAKLREALVSAVREGTADKIDVFEYCALMRAAYEEAFTSKVIKSSFLRAGVWPLNPSRLLSAPLPRSANDVGNIIGVEEIRALYEEKTRAARAAVLGSDARVLSCGYLDTSNGLVLTSARAMELARKKMQHDKARRKEKEMATLRKDLNAARRKHAEKVDIDLRRQASWRIRAFLAGVPENMFRASVRPLAERRAIAKLRTASRRQATEDNVR
eukprot:IDg6070t1